MPARPSRLRSRWACLALAVACFVPAGAPGAAADVPPGPAPRPSEPPPPAAPAPPPPGCTLEKAGEPRAQRDAFEALPPDATAPKAFVPFAGRWTLIPEPEAKRGNTVLRQDRPTDPWAVALFQGEGRALEDGVARVRFRPVSGDDDAAGGIVFRAQDERNYYLARANGLEDNLRLYVIKEGHRWQLATVAVDPPKIGAWHTLEVRAAGKTLRATLDGGPAVETTDPTFARGWCGLWTKSDSVTWFDDWSVEPDKPQGAPSAPAATGTPPATPKDAPAPKDPLPGGDGR